MVYPVTCNRLLFLNKIITKATDALAMKLKSLSQGSVTSYKGLWFNPNHLKMVKQAEQTDQKFVLKFTLRTLWDGGLIEKE